MQNIQSILNGLRGEGVAKNVDNLITFCSLFISDKNVKTCAMKTPENCDVSLSVFLPHKPSNTDIPHIGTANYD